MKSKALKMTRIGILMSGCSAKQEEAASDIQVFEGRVCSGDQFIATSKQKEKIVSDFGGMCCEMEGAAIAQACYLNGTPFVVMRVISDKPDETEIVDYKAFEAEAAKNCAGIVRLMVETRL